MLCGITIHHPLWLLGEKHFPSASSPGNHALLQRAGEIRCFPTYFGEKMWLCVNSECRLCSSFLVVFIGTWVASPCSHLISISLEPQGTTRSLHTILSGARLAEPRLFQPPHILAPPRPRRTAATCPHSPKHTGVSWLFPGSKPEVTSVCSIFLDYCTSLSLAYLMSSKPSSHLFSPVFFHSFINFWKFHAS